jgi:SNF family Na+-dependent transporter
MGIVSNKEKTEYIGKRSKTQELIGLVICVLFAVFFAWLAKSSWNDFVDLEENGKNLEVDNFTYILYNLGGKLLATSFLWALSLFFIFFGIKRGIGLSKAE